MIFQFSKKRLDDNFLSMEYHVYWLLKSSYFEFSEKENTVFFRAKKLMERWYLLITENFLL